MKKMLRFFATPQELKKGLHETESIVSVKYIKRLLYKSKNIPEYKSYKALDSLGISSGNSQGSDQYLVVLSDDDWKYEGVMQKKDGSYHYFVDQYLNKNSIILSTGGLYQDKYLIVGQFDTIHYENEQSAKIFKAMKKAFAKVLKNKVPGYLVGDEVYEIKDQVRLITMGTDEPIEYDLKLPDKK